MSRQDSDDTSQHDTPPGADRAILVGRGDDDHPDLAELRGLADAAGYAPVNEVTQRRPEDNSYQVGRGKAEELMRLVGDVDADAVIFENELSPRQTYELGELLPEGIDLLDRLRLVLDVFADQAGTREAKLQVRLAELRYELPRVREQVRLERQESNERTAGGGMRGAAGGIDEKEHRRVRDIRERIERVEAKLEGIDDQSDERRRRRREAGFDLVAVAGYTNAGKSTLLQRLADDLDLGDNDARPADASETAAAEDRLFKTLDTTTRRATVGDRRLLLTDTVGFVRDLPHWLVESFESTLTAAYEADTVVLLVDASDDPETARSKLETSLDVLEDAEGELVVALNKVDAVDDDHLAAVEDAVAALGPDPIAVSALEGDGIDRLGAEVADTLPTDALRVDLPNDGDTQSFLAWAHDHATVEDVTYEGDRVRATVRGRPEVLARARGRVTDRPDATAAKRD